MHALTTFWFELEGMSIALQGNDMIDSMASIVNSSEPEPSSCSITIHFLTCRSQEYFSQLATQLLIHSQLQLADANFGAFRQCTCCFQPTDGNQSESILVHPPSLSMPCRASIKLLCSSMHLTSEALHAARYVASVPPLHAVIILHERWEVH